jgi:phosphohistidine phosphatase
MSRDLLLMRHADALPEGVGGDHERPLSEWGRVDARRMAEVLRQEGLEPGRIVVSTARRTCETVERVLHHIGSRPVVEEPKLYLASVSTVMQIIDVHSKEPGTLLIVAHNPALETIVSTMAGVRIPFPTATLAHVVLESGQLPEVRGIWRTEDLTVS